MEVIFGAQNDILCRNCITLDITNISFLNEPGRRAADYIKKKKTSRLNITTTTTKPSRLDWSINTAGFELPSSSGVVWP
jgi:hypothetical protein